MAIEGVSLRVVREDAEALRLEAPSPGELVRLARTTSGEVLELRLANVAGNGGLLGCLACGHPELYTQKDFPRAIGLTVVVIAAVLAPFTWYASLLVAAAVDWALFHGAPEVVLCYVCRAEHRGFADSPRHPRFDREIDERLRYGSKAVMGREMRPEGTAGAPEPEH